MRLACAFLLLFVAAIVADDSVAIQTLKAEWNPPGTLQWTSLLLWRHVYAVLPDYGLRIVSKAHFSMLAVASPIQMCFLLAPLIT